MLESVHLRSGAIVGLLLAATLVSHGASAKAGALDRGLALYGDLRYEEAVPYLEEALGDTRLPEEDRARAAVVLGVIRIALGRSDEGRSCFDRAVALDPDVAPPADSSPKILRLLDEARTSRAAGASGGSEAAGGPPLAAHEAPSVSAGPVEIRVELSPARTVTVRRVVVHHRTLGDGLWLETEAKPRDADHYAATLPMPFGAEGIEYWISVTGTDGTELARLGDEKRPFVVRSPAQAPEAAVAVAPEPEAEAEAGEGSPVPWWVWAGLGGLVLAGAGAAVLLSSDGGDCAAPSGAGCVDVRLP